NVVMKFGGAAMASLESIQQVAELVAERRREARRIVIVVSAMGDTTDRLIALAKEVHPSPPRREFDMLLTVGERVSIALLAMALDRRGCEAVSFTGSQSGIMTSNEHCDARIVDVRPRRIVAALDQGKIAIVAGFQGCSLQGEITTLGRGGSDTTAVALGVALASDCVEFYKDVPGVFAQDPKLDADAQALPVLSYDALLELLKHGHPVLHPRCVELAARNALPLQVRSFLPQYGSSTWIRGEGAPVDIPCFESPVRAIEAL
ncbi:MAG: aspartate kinase, partial [Chlamydiia bacterium]|nr:aspartate kinase [Chlamydiia bacterium]